MHTVEFECSPAEADVLIAELWERAVVGIEQEDLPEGRCRLRGYFEFAVELPGLERFSPRWLPVEPRDWVAFAHAQWQPVEVGERFFLVPDWMDTPAPPGRLRLEMRPGRACGTGWAAPTQLMLEMMERTIRAGQVVVDIGTGAGILAVAAARLGASKVLACDIDHDASVEAADRLRYERLEPAVFTGSVRSVRDSSVDVALANLNGATLLNLAEEIARIRAPGSAALLSGFRERHLDAVRNAFGCTAEPLEKDGWLALRA